MKRCSSLEHDHFLLGHLPHRVRDAADAVSGLAPSGEGHPVDAEGGVVVDHHGRGVEALGGVKAGARSSVKMLAWNATGQRVGGCDRVVELACSG